MGDDLKIKSGSMKLFSFNFLSATSDHLNDSFKKLFGLQIEALKFQPFKTAAGFFEDRILFGKHTGVVSV
jgi:hypothetical protein